MLSGTAWSNWWHRPHPSSWQCKGSHRCCHGPLVPLAMGDSGTSTIFTWYESMVIMISLPKWKNHCEEPSITQRWIYTCYRVVNTEHHEDGCADGERHLPNIWQKVINKEGATILKVHKLILKIFISDGHIDDNFWEKNLCHSRDSNHRSPVFRTGALTT